LFGSQSAKRPQRILLVRRLPALNVSLFHSRCIAEPAARALGLSSFAPPITLATARIGQVWHDRLDADAGHTWLRGLIAEVARDI
jgi:hypothetical protein